jgi:hypothetical protein
MGYQGGGKMTDILIRDIPDEVIAGLALIFHLG